MSDSVMVATIVYSRETGLRVDFDLGAIPRDALPLLAHMLHDSADSIARLASQDPGLRPGAPRGAGGTSTPPQKPESTFYGAFRVLPALDEKLRRKDSAPPTEPPTGGSAA